MSGTPIKAKMVHISSSVENMSRHEMINWVNGMLYANLLKIEEMSNGAAYCQLMHILFPTCISLKRVKFNANLEYESLHNFTILQNAFNKVKTEKQVPTQKLIKGKFQDNFEFLQWFKKFFDANYEEREYDALAARFGIPLGSGKARKEKAKELTYKAIEPIPSLVLNIIPVEEAEKTVSFDRTTTSMNSFHQNFEIGGNSSNTGITSTPNQLSMSFTNIEEISSPIVNTFSLSAHQDTAYGTGNEIKTEDASAAKDVNYRQADTTVENADQVFYFRNIKLIEIMPQGENGTLSAKIIGTVDSSK